MSISEIRVLLAQHLIRQADVAFQANISESRLCRILRNRIRPREGELERITEIIRGEVERKGVTCSQ